MHSSTSHRIDLPYTTISLYLKFPIMSQLTFTVNNKEISHKDLNIVRDFFTDEQWDCIYDAVSEYQDFPEKEEITRDTISVINQVFTSSY